MEKSRSKKALNNTIAGFSLEIVTLICGLILPRLILRAFGSSYNGITQSISQFISCITLMKAGIGGVTRAALYRPLAEGDDKTISEIVVSTERFMRRVALFFVFGVFVFACLYPVAISRDFPWLFSFSLILIISISTFVQYYFGLTYQMLLMADQKQSVISIIQIVSVVLNTVIAAILIRIGAGIHVVKLGSAAAFAMNPLLITLFVHRHYRIDKKVVPTADYIGQRWDALGHEVANFINSNTDIIVLTIFSGLKEVSVYSVYAYVITAIRSIVSNFVTGFGAAFGDMYAKKEVSLMHENLGIFELIVFSVAGVVYAVTLAMITPFALIYTHGLTDVSYDRPVFGIVITLAGAFTCFRIPYYAITTAVGHYRQTRNGAFVEAALNIAISIACVVKFGLVGVAIGTLVAAAFRSTQYALYLGRNILKRSFFRFLGHVAVALGIFAAVYWLGMVIDWNTATVVGWIIKAVMMTLIALGLVLLTDLLFWRDDFVRLVRKGLSVLHRKKEVHHVSDES